MAKRIVWIVLLLMGAQAATYARERKADEPMSAADSAFNQLSLKEHFFYGYNFDIFYHHDTQDLLQTNGFSISILPELGYKISPKMQTGVRFGGSYFSQRETYPVIIDDKESSEKLLVMGGSWEVTPYWRYRLKTLFNGSVGIWLDLHCYTGMEFPNVLEGNPDGTSYNGLRHTVSYGVQIAPLITYQFNKKSTFNLFISIMSLGYSGSTYVYKNDEGEKQKEYRNDLILFSGRLSNLLSSQFTLGLYGIKFGVQKNF